MPTNPPPKKRLKSYADLVLVQDQQNQNPPTDNTTPSHAHTISSPGADISSPGQPISPPGADISGIAHRLPLRGDRQGPESQQPHATTRHQGSPGGDKPPQVVVTNEITTSFLDRGSPDQPIPSPGTDISSPGQPISPPGADIIGVAHRSPLRGDPTRLPGDTLHATEPQPPLPRTAAHSTAPSHESIVMALTLQRTMSPHMVHTLQFLNDHRSAHDHTLTQLIGQQTISYATGISKEYLRKYVLPKLAARGIIHIMAQHRTGTIYKLPYPSPVIALLTTDPADIVVSCDLEHAAITHDTAPPSLPHWVNRVFWNQLTPTIIARLVSRAGSEEAAEEILSIIEYNQSHGPEHTRVKKPMSVLMNYLNNPQSGIWPADDGYETLTVRRARLERDQAAKQKALAEETFKAQQEERLLRFRTGLSEAQWAWIRNEAKRAVDSAPKAQQEFMGPRTRLNMYKAKEDELIREWLDRTAYGETVPEQA